MEKIKSPLFMSVGIACLVAALGAAMGWFSIENQFVRDLAESELATKQNLSIAISVGCLGLTALAAKLSKKPLAIVAALIGIYGLVLIMNQKPDAAIAEQIGLLVKPGYWLSIAGTLAMMIGNAIIGIKGFELFKAK